MAILPHRQPKSTVNCNNMRLLYPLRGVRAHLRGHGRAHGNGGESESHFESFGEMEKWCENVDDWCRYGAAHGLYSVLAACLQIARRELEQNLPYLGRSSRSREWPAVITCGVGVQKGALAHLHALDVRAWKTSTAGEGVHVFCS